MKGVVDSDETSEESEILFSQKRRAPGLEEVILELDIKLDMIWQVIRRNDIHTVSLTKHFFFQANQRQ